MDTLQELKQLNQTYEKEGLLENFHMKKVRAGGRVLSLCSLLVLFCWMVVLVSNASIDIDSDNPVEVEYKDQIKQNKVKVSGQ